MYRLIISNVFVKDFKSISDATHWALDKGYESYSVLENGSEVFSIEHLTVKRC